MRISLFFNFSLIRFTFRTQRFLIKNCASNIVKFFQKQNRNKFFYHNFFCGNAVLKLFLHTDGAYLTDSHYNALTGILTCTRFEPPSRIWKIVHFCTLLKIKNKWTFQHAPFYSSSYRRNWNLSPRYNLLTCSSSANSCAVPALNIFPSISR